MLDYIKRNWRSMVIIVVTIGLHVALLNVVNIYIGERQKRKDNTVFKIVDVKEYVPPPPPPPKEEKKEEVVEVTKQEDIVEDVIETEKEIKELDIEYLPQNKISQIPGIPMKEIRSKIDYPYLANKQGIEGVVFLELFIDNKGVIRDIKILKEPGFGLGEAAIKAFENITCSPALANGIPVAVRFRVPIRFQLKK